jgi:pyruvate dehydrogenase E2 component (dihydrolipoamide acetyltransferase)
METIVRMPKLGSTMETGTIIKWFKNEGDEVVQGEPLFEVATEKIVNEIEAPASGILAKILAPQDSEHPVRTPIAIIAAPGEDISGVLSEIESDSDQVASEVASDSKQAAEEPQKVSEQDDKEESEVLASPAARKLAKEYGLDLSAIAGTGSGGRITREDVEKYLSTQRAQAEIISLSPMRRRIAEHMAMSIKTSPHVTLMTEADVTELANLIKRHNGDESGVKLTFTDFIVKASAMALHDFPRMNSSFSEQGIKVFSQINVGVAVALEEGLVVPPVRDADSKDIRGISQEIKTLASKARSNTLTEEDLTGGTFTVSNLGMYGIDLFTPIINQPEAGILGVGRATDKPVVRDGEIVIRKMMGLSLSFDHRVIDGAQAAEFLQRIVKYLEQPDLVMG